MSGPIDRSGSPRTQLIDSGSPRSLFGELIAQALGALGHRPSPAAIAYLLGLLEEGIAGPAAASPPGGEDVGLLEILLHARLDDGPHRLAKLRSVGDRALFVAGMFGDSLSRRLVDIDDYGRIGSRAYEELVAELAAAGPERRRTRVWLDLFRELSDDFHTFLDVLAEVADRMRHDSDASALRIYDRFLATGSERDRQRLVARGIAPTRSPSLRRLQ